MSTETTSAAGTAWAPFRHRLFAEMWTAQFVSNIGSWMQTVGAQWLMLTLTGSAAYVALVSTAGSLPVMLDKIRAMTDPDHGAVVTHWLTAAQAADPGSRDGRQAATS